MSLLRKILLAFTLALPTLFVGTTTASAQVPIAAAIRPKPLDLNRSTDQRKLIDNDKKKKSFPRLGRNFEVRGSSTKTYNCIAWSLGIKDRWVWPGGTVNDFDRLYGEKGYKRVQKLDYRRQENVDKIVLYAKKGKDGKIEATHAARQLSDGSWSSKLGQLPLIRHLSPNDLNGPSYGTPVAVYVRTRSH